MATATAHAPAGTALQTTGGGNPAFIKLRDQLEKAKDKLLQVAPKYLKVDRITRLLLAACSKTPKILECTPESVLQFAMKCAETGLEPIGAGGAWPIPFENKRAGTVELTFMPDYRGLVNCGKRADCIKDAYAEAVYEGDEFDYELGMDQRLFHKPARGVRGELQAAYVVLVFPDGTKRFVVMHKEEIEGIRDNHSKSYQNWLKYKKPTPWVTDPGEMWKKTVVRRAMKPFTGMSAELTAAIEADIESDALPVAEAEPVPMPRAIGESANGNGKHESSSQFDEPGASTDSPGDNQNETQPMVTADQIKALEKLAGQQGTLHKWRKYLQELYGIEKPDAALLTAEQARQEAERLEACLAN